MFKLVWTIAIDIEPGIGGEFEIEEVDIPIMAPCSCPEAEAELVEAEEQGPEEQPEDEEEREDNEERGGGKKKSGKKKRKGRD
jgi:hypothetical protein